MMKLSFGHQKVSRLSTEFVQAIQDTGLDDSFNPLPAVPLGGEIEFAFIPLAEEPTSLDWHPGEGVAVFGDQYARVLIGPEGVQEFEPGRYAVWIRITDPPEKGVHNSGVLDVY